MDTERKTLSILEDLMGNLFVKEQELDNDLTGLRRAIKDAMDAIDIILEENEEGNEK